MTKHKILPIMATAILAGAMFFAGCEKEKIENKSITKALNPSIVNGITVYDGILQFGTIFDYENFIEYFSPEQDGFNDSLFSECMDYLDELNFTSLYDYKQSQNDSVKKHIDSVYCSDFIQHVLNSSHIVIIGDYVFKLNMETESVYVLPTDNISDISDLINENTNNANIIVFTTEDDVFEELENMVPETLMKQVGEFQQKARCNEDGCAGTGINGVKDGVITKYFIGGNLNGGRLALCAIAKYVKFGIYFEVSSVAEWRLEPVMTLYESNPTVVADCTFKRRCKNLITLSTRTKNGNDNKGHVKKLIYSCARALSKINLQVHATGMDDGINWQTPVVVHRRNI